LLSNSMSVETAGFDESFRDFVTAFPGRALSVAD
jgi:hypothetical protein